MVSRVSVITLVTGSASARLQGVADSNNSLQNDEVVPIKRVNVSPESIQLVPADVKAPIVVTNKTKVILKRMLMQVELVG